MGFLSRIARQQIPAKARFLQLELTNFGGQLVFQKRVHGRSVSPLAPSSLVRSFSNHSGTEFATLTCDQVTQNFEHDQSSRIFTVRQ